MSELDDSPENAWLDGVAAALPEVVILTCVNHGYAASGLVENWYRSLCRIGLEKHVLIGALDAPSHEFLVARGLPVIRWNSARFAEVTPEALEYRRDGWQAVVFSKVDLVTQFLRAGKSVLFSDADVVFLRNPLPHLESLDGDFSIQSNVRAGRASDVDFSPQTTCSGFYFARPSEAVRRALDLSEVALGNYAGEQKLLHERTVENDELEVNVLPRERYPNGDYWLGRNPLRPDVIHFNWVVGVKKKIEEMIRSGVWFLQTGKES